MLKTIKSLWRAIRAWHRDNKITKRVLAYVDQNDCAVSMLKKIASLPNTQMELANNAEVYRLIKPISHFVGLQPMDTPVALLYKLRAIQHEPLTYTNLQIETAPVAAENITFAFAKDKEKQIKVEVANQLLTKLVQRIESIAETTEQEFINKEELSLVVAHHANEIAKDTDRDVGNAIIISSTLANRLTGTLDRLIDHSTPALAFVGNAPAFGISTMSSVAGGPGVPVFESSVIEDDSMILAFKGNISETDAGLFFVPYVLIQSMGATIDPQTFEPKSAIVSRYGIHQDDASSNYYRKLKFNFND